MKLSGFTSHLAWHLLVSDLPPPRHFSGVQVAAEDTGLLQTLSESLTVPGGHADAFLDQLPVMEIGEAGPPGKMTMSKLPGGTDGSLMPVQGFAGAPGETCVNSLCSAVCRRWLLRLVFWFNLAASHVKSSDSLKTSVPLIPGEYSFNTFLPQFDKCV